MFWVMFVCPDEAPVRDERLLSFIFVFSLINALFSLLFGQLKVGFSVVYGLNR